MPTNNKGFSTIEILVAMAILILCLTAVVLVSAGSQSLLTDSQVSRQALSFAQELLEKAQADARKDFKLVVSTSSSETVGPVLYGKQIAVTTHTSGPDEYIAKDVTATVSWTGEFGRSQRVSLTGLVTNFNYSKGADTCDSVLAGNWSAPQVTAYDIASLASESPGVFTVSDVDVYHKKLYVAVSDRPRNTDATLFMFDVSSPTAPILVAKVDNASTVSAGPSAVVTDGNHVYTANSYGANFSTCTQGNNCAQLQIFNASTLAGPINLKFFGVTGSGGQAVGKSIFYRDGYVYVGLSKTASGPEFNIVDVHNPAAPVRVGSFAVAGAVNAITVLGNYAYLGTPNSQELIVLDISNPASPVQVSGYDAPGGSGNGKSLYTVGDTLYLGRTLGGSEFFVIDNKNPSVNPLPSISSYDLGASSGLSVNKLVVRDYLAFLFTNNKLEIVNLRNMTSFASVSLPGAAASGGSAMDCEGNVLYGGANAANKIYIITAP